MDKNNTYRKPNTGMLEQLYRRESDYFVDDVIVLDKNFSKIGDIVKGTNKTVPHDTLYVKIVK